MGVNLDRPARWKDDIAKSVDFYNNWFLEFAPEAFREARKDSVGHVTAVFQWTAYLTNIVPQVLSDHPEALSVLRQCTAPPLARDRIVGLAGVRTYLVNKMETDGVIPPSYTAREVERGLRAISAVLAKMLDRDIFAWTAEQRDPSEEERLRAATVVADRLTGAVSNPIIRNAQETRQLHALSVFLEQRGYRELDASERSDWQTMPSGTYARRLNLVTRNQSGGDVNVPVDLIVQPLAEDREPVLIEAKSAGDFTNTNKRRKEEAQKRSQLVETYGSVRYVLFLCGYFDSGYLGYEAAEGIDWVWEHRTEDLTQFGI